MTIQNYDRYCQMKTNYVGLIFVISCCLILKASPCRSLITNNNHQGEANVSRTLTSDFEQINTPTNTITPIRLPQPRPIGESNNHNRTNRNGSLRQRRPNSNANTNKLSTNCLAKREEILRKRKYFEHNSSTVDTQELKPKFTNDFHDKNASQTDVWLLNENEHEPNCTDAGLYEPVQCSMGFCWCVNKYGQAIKNSAAEDPELRCDPTLYESQTGASHVVRGLSSEAANILQAPTRNSRNTSSGPPNNSTIGSNGEASADPLLSLIPNNCGLSRERAQERATRNSVENVWIPECDRTDQRFYEIKQCHRQKVCWCVNECTGLPLETKDQLSKDLNIDCTEIIKNIDSSCKEPHSKYLGFSKYCDDRKRFQIVNSLLGQFKTRLSGQVNLKSMSERQIFETMFATLDTNKDGFVADREWFHFKENYKIVERIDPDTGSQYHFSQSHKPDWSKIPLNILKSQRRCWRDMLDFCSGNNLLEFEISISLEKWLDCTRLPPQSQRHLYHSANRRIQAYSREAALIRMNSTNPMLNFKSE